LCAGRNNKQRVAAARDVCGKSWLMVAVIADAHLDTFDFKAFNAVLRGIRLS
jgi:hypothetical protein